MIYTPAKFLENVTIIWDNMLSLYQNTGQRAIIS